MTEPAYDPNDYTVAEIQEWAATATDDELEAALELELAGKNRVTAVAALGGGEEVEGQATTAMTKDWLGRALVTPGTVGKDYMGRLILAGDKDYMNRNLVA